jgi:hypothetical protein
MKLILVCGDFIHITQFIIKNIEQKKMWKNFVAQEGIDDFLLCNTGYAYFDTMLKNSHKYLFYMLNIYMYYI